MSGPLATLAALSAAGSALGLALMLAQRLIRGRLPSAFWYYAWLPVFLRMLLPLPGLLRFDDDAAARAADLPSEPAWAEPAEPRAYRYGSETITLPDGLSEAGPYAEPDAEAVPTETEAVQAAEPDPPSLWDGVKALLSEPGLWLGVWAAGALACLARYIVSYERFRRAILRSARTADGPAARIYAALGYARRPGLYCSEYVKTPMLLGLWKPLIVLPAGPLTAEAARNILLHELTHHRRGDLYIKWFAVLVRSLHWFNPLMPLFRRELDRVCELSCDEHLLRRMDFEEKRSYGETLLDLAASQALPAGVVGTTFATEKRNLRERLEQIMNYEHRTNTVFALAVAALVLLCGCAAALGPASEPAASEPETVVAELASFETQDGVLPASGASRDNAVAVSTVDELLAAIGPDTTIVLASGTYDLSQASDYGADGNSPYYHWEDVHDGYELVIAGADDLTIAADASDPADTVISAVPRYADVLAFQDCAGLALTGFTAGHTVEPGLCAGGVLDFQGCGRVSVDNCALYGCGILGVTAENCRVLYVTGTDIYECSSGGARLTSCYDVRFMECDFRDCGDREFSSPAYAMLQVTNSYGMAAVDCHIYSNHAQTLLLNDYSQEVYLLGTLMESNQVEGFVLSGAGDVIVSGCEFKDNAVVAEGGVVCLDLSGNPLSRQDLEAMTREAVPYVGPKAVAEVALERTQEADGRWRVEVSTVDELLAAIAPDTTVYLAAGVYDLDEASAYGAYGGQYYYWSSTYDGPGLVISGADGLRLVGAGKDAVTLRAAPRYADVIRFAGCADIAVEGLTAGHTRGSGGCAGSVLYFLDSSGIEVKDCGLYGCGILGIQAQECENITATGNEIYECSNGAVSLYECRGAEFADNDIHDCAYPTYSFSVCKDITLDGAAVEEESTGSPFGAASDEVPVEVVEEWAASSPVAKAIFDTGSGVFTSINVPGAGPYRTAS